MNADERDLLPEEEELTSPPVEPDPLDDLSDPDNPEANADTDMTELLTQELNDLKDQLLRTMADFQNFRKRAQQDKQLTQRLATEDLIRDLLPILDNFDRTVAAAGQGATMESLLEGVGLVHRQMLTILSQRNLERIKTTGEIFDPEFHEAIATEPNPDVPEGTIIAELEAGYRLGDRTVRPARVRVARG